MKDAKGRNVRLGDRVKLWENHFGRVVCAFDDDAFSNKYPKNDWGHLKIGVLIELDSGEVFHYDKGDEDFEIISSGNTDTNR